MRSNEGKKKIIVCSLSRICNMPPTILGMKMAVFWVVAPCSLVEVCQRFRVPCCLHHQGDRPDDGGRKDL
jgi:hypothetical protein